MVKYDGLLFGNGLTLNTLSQLKNFIPLQKQYLLSTDNFFRNFISGTISDREKQKIFKLFYTGNKLENAKYFEILIKELSCYFDNHDANIEYYFGYDLFRADSCKYDYTLLMTIFPYLYNIWHEILIEYIHYFKLEKYILNFTNSINQILGYPDYIFTLNFDKFADNLNPEHLHGKFVSPYRKFRELDFKRLNKSEYLFKCLWGYNGVGKYWGINEYKKVKGHEEFFDFSFFFDHEMCIDNLLVYGIGFQRSGYIKDLATYKSKYEKPVTGGIVDEHILMRLEGLQNKKQLGKITFSYYSDPEMEYFEKLIDYFELKNTTLLKSTEFDFSIK